VLEEEHLNRIAGQLLHQTNSQALHWCGRAATALHWGFSALYAWSTARGITAPEVIVPALGCPTITNMAHLSGFTVRFADVDPASGLTTLTNLQARYSPTKTVAVAIVHLYGNTADMAPIVQWANLSNVWVVEDVVHALGGHYTNGQQVGSEGHFVVYGFNAPKMMTCGGGALVVRHPELVPLVALEVAKPLPHPLPQMKLEALSNGNRDFTQGLTRLRRAGLQLQVGNLFQHVQANLEPIYRKPFTTAEAFLQQWPQLAAFTAHRVQAASVYGEMLQASPAFTLLSNPKASGTCWRFTLSYNTDALRVQAFSEALRKRGFDVSNLYVSLPWLFETPDVCPNAEQLACTVVNLWVDNATPLAKAQACAEAALELASAF
jgi:dTDP-4-amino-4,6-dideoxygalactose transaminase